MNFRARLSLFALEGRENPSVPYIDPITGAAPPPSDPTPPAPPTDPVSIISGAAGAGAAGAAGSTTPPPPVDPLLGNNSIYNVPLVP